MHGPPQSVALNFIKQNTRHKESYGVQTHHPSEERRLAMAATLEGMSDDNKCLYLSLSQYIEDHVQAKIESHMKEMTNTLHILQKHVETGGPQTGSRDLGKFWEAKCSPKSTEPGLEKIGQDVALTPFSTANAQDQSLHCNNEHDLHSNDDALRHLTSPETPPMAIRAPDAHSAVTVDNLEDDAAEAEKVKEEAKRQKMRLALKRAERIEDAEAALSRLTRTTSHIKASVHRKEDALDAIMALVILSNMVLIGVSMDYPEDSAVEILDIIFTAFFLIEMFLKFYLLGFREYFSHGLNVFDFCIVVFDTTQLCFRQAEADTLSEAPAASMFRVLRLARLMRLVRLIQLGMFDDLVALISGMIGGMSTLLWSIVLFFIILFIASLLFREFFGQDSYPMPLNDEDLTDYFNSVPRCMLTVFRFFFGDFSTLSGLSILEGIQQAYGSVAAVLLCVFFFMITVGLFNVIAAIFVESTLAAANNAQIARKTARMNDECLWATRVSLLIQKFFEYRGDHLEGRMSDNLDEVADRPIPEAMFQQFMMDHDVIHALNDLEIDQADHKYLFDILDNDNTGSILVSQVTDGLERLRGDPRRSDIICVDLMLRSIQQQTDFLVQAAKTNVRSSAGNREKMKENANSLHRIEGLIMSHIFDGRSECN